MAGTGDDEAGRVVTDTIPGGASPGPVATAAQLGQPAVSSAAPARPGSPETGAVPRVAVLWQRPTLGLYSNAPLDDLYKGVGRNTGNLVYVHAIASHIANPTVFLPWHARPEVLRASADLLVFPCANQLGPHTDLGAMGDKLAETGLPIVAIGLGAQTKGYDEDMEISPGTRRWVEAIAALRSADVPNILTRGAFTSAQLEKAGIPGAQTGGCPSHFINPARDLGERIAANWAESTGIRSISVAAGHQSWAHVRTIEQQLIALMMDPIYPGQYVVQSMVDMLKMSRNEFSSIDPTILERIRLHTVPHYTHEEFIAWCRRFARSFYDVPAWMDALRRHDLTIGPRYHGVALALQAERMGITVTIDSRTRELCEYTGVPHVSHQDLTGPITRQSLRKLIKFNPRHYDSHRRDMARAYVAFLQGNSIRPAAFLLDLAR